VKLQSGQLTNILRPVVVDDVG